MVGCCFSLVTLQLHKMIINRRCLYAFPTNSTVHTVACHKGAKYSDTWALGTPKGL